MEKKIFNKITKDIFLEYGFKKYKNKYVLELDKVTIIVTFRSYRGVKSFDYYYYLNDLYDDSVPFCEKYDSVIEFHMEHTPSLRGYQAHEILFEEYDESFYAELLINMLHRYFDPFKEDAIKYLKDRPDEMGLRIKAKKYLGLI